MEGFRVPGTPAKFLGERVSGFCGILGLRESKGLEYLTGKIRVIFHSKSSNSTQDNSDLHEVELRMLFI